jgi:hypothetical protein
MNGIGIGIGLTAEERKSRCSLVSGFRLRIEGLDREEEEDDDVVAAWF